MANHGYAHIKQKLTVEQINSDLMEINKSRFNDIFEITHSEDSGDEIWWICLKEMPDFGFQIWLDLKKKKIEWPHKTMGDSGWWFHETFMSLLVTKYDGKISDDGCEGRWKPEFHIKYPHMIDWFMWNVNTIDGRIKKAFFRKLNNGRYKEELKHLPESIKEVI
jgi:hypothetical protein